MAACLVAGLPANALAKRIEDRLAPCRSTFPEVMADPNAGGGWRLIQRSTEREDGTTDAMVLCLYGALPLVEVPGLLAALPSPSGLTVAVRSTGGPAESWLRLAEHLRPAKIELLVDEVCFSSCANYLPVIAGSILAASNSLLAWHGGPADLPEAEATPARGTVAEIIDHDGLSRRTLALYAAKGVSPELLRVSAMRTSDRVMRRLLAGMAASARPSSIAGYAFSPHTLSECFGLHSAKAMWHAGDDAALIRLAQRRSAGLIVLESPKTRRGERICRSAPVDRGAGKTR